MWSTQCFVLLTVAGAAAGLSCYNCSETQYETNQCAGSFGTGAISFNASRLRLATCTGDNAMCFVRSWSARAKHAWLVQRGCYKSSPDDPLPHTVRSPTRAMSCKRERYRDAEYRVCLCQADWCNSAKWDLHTPLHVSTLVGLANVLRSLYLP
ncbi:uncharacterized protein LOC134678622 isoform X2 [Cydia fagiglandana]|uniref:uncharacterized protein LOC134678622 isoform X2 n=1 Tax=Cydia fagiglandana TaxID=1458189 RepID=UPI002FEE5441